MSFRFKMSSMLVALMLVSLTWVSTAQAQATHPVHPFYSSARFQIGNGLPIPITFAPAPRGRVAPVPGATVMQTGTSGTIMQGPSQFTAPGNPINIPVFLANMNVFEVQTTIPLTLPNATVTFQANHFGGTTTVTDTHMFSLLGAPSIGTFIYTKTGNQFGGPARGFVGGQAIVMIRAKGTPPCGIATCQVAVDIASPAPTGVIGAPFNVTNTDPGTPAVNPGVFAASVTAAGFVSYVTPTGIPVPGPTNAATSAGAPFTTGRITHSITMTANGGTEIFIRTGSDARTAGGAGQLSLISAAVSDRVASLPNANRGWLNLLLPEPGAVMGTVGALLMLATCHTLVRRRSR